MTTTPNPTPSPAGDAETEIERVVRAHLDREAAGVNPEAILARVHAAVLSNDGQPIETRQDYRDSDDSPVRPALGRKALWFAVGGVGVGVGSLVAACVVLFVLLSGGDPHDKPVVVGTPTSASDILELARATHTAPTDRRYDVRAEWDDAALNQLKLESAPQLSRLWTRGDQFYVETPDENNKTTAWGQSRNGQVWVAVNRKQVLVYDASEENAPIRKYSDLMSLRVLTMLNELLSEYDLQKEGTGTPGERIRIAATPKPTQSKESIRYQKVDLVIDPETMAIQSAVFKRKINGTVVGTLTFSLAENGTLADNAYDLHGHVDADYKLIDGTPPKHMGAHDLPGIPNPGPPAPNVQAKAPPANDPRTKLLEGILKGFKQSNNKHGGGSGRLQRSGFHRGW
ncbi:LolA family protein [Fimbriiglobus ruber]|uniref:Uncharacterized protein n=1 Tax=Fimbriiglobus ruber TaxID=1908690 RepID=A0A225E665_9BACT|nr:hypothetical protein [Fimbriiglobus ruber]OWK43917.1 hypothetical protein FRUB_03516 [Fimbriiglobus ruber]